MTTFPDTDYLQSLAAHLREKVLARLSPEEQFVMFAGGALNWIGDFMTDPNVSWSKETLPIDRLWLTGTGPEWNKIIIEQCERSPAKLRQVMQTDPAVADMFVSASFHPEPVLIRFEDEKLKLLDGMHRTIAAIRDGHQTIKAWVARLQGTPQPQCEPHVVYDLLRAYGRGNNKDRAGLVAALRFLRVSYSNVDQLLRERFSKDWLPNEEAQQIITEVLKPS